MMKLLTIICLLSVSACAESPEELLNSTTGLTNDSAAVLLFAHNYDVTYSNGSYYLNGTEFKQCLNTKMFEEDRRI